MIGNCDYCHGARTPCTCTADCGTRIHNGSSQKTCPRANLGPERTTPLRDLSEFVDSYGHISIEVTFNASDRTKATSSRSTGANHTPEMIARFFRELADDVERIPKG